MEGILVGGLNMRLILAAEGRKVGVPILPFSIILRAIGGKSGCPEVFESDCREENGCPDIIP